MPGSIDIEKLRTEIEGEALDGAFDKGRYATDASIYQITPRAVVIPKRWEDVEAVRSFAVEAGVPVLARGGGTSQSGQTVNEAIVVDFSKHLNRVLDCDLESRRVTVEPGLVLDELNRGLKKDRLWFPVDVSTASRATLGGMAANNSCGSRSRRYGKMRDNTLAIEAMLADGETRRFGAVERSVNDSLFAGMLALGAREATEIEARFPKVSRRVGGYNIDALTPEAAPNNMAHLLVGSEGTLAISRKLELQLSPTLDAKTLGVCHFPTFYAAMDAAQHIVKLDPVAVELMDHNMIRLGRDIPQFRPIVDEFVRGDPAALLLVEFAEPDSAENRRRLTALGDLMAELGFRWGDPGKAEGGVVEAEDPGFQARIWVRAQGLNIMMSMRSEGKPVSFVEDCAVELEHLAEFTDRLTGVFRKHGTDGTWYAHASVGLLHVRPVLNLKQELGARQLRAIAEEAFAIVAEYKGSHSGEHGDGIVRSEFHERMFGSRIVRAFEEVKDRFDPAGLLNPGKITRAPKMDDRSLFRTPPGYAAEPRATAFDWSAWPGGLTGAAEMCNNNGACRKLAGGAMCPSYRATRNERDVTRGRANTLRLALTGQLGPGAFASDEMMETMKLCVSCKSCKRECPMSVDMAKMKIEVLAARAEAHGVPLRERLIAHLPRYAPWAARLRWLANARDQIPGLAALSERAVGFSAKRKLPSWRKPFREGAAGGDVLVFADTFNRYFEPDNLRAATRVLRAAGYAVGVASAGAGRPLCCGRSYLSAGLVDAAKAEMRRSVGVFAEALSAGKSIVGLEPSCILTFRDEAPMLLGRDWTEEMGRNIMTFEEFVARERRTGKFDANFNAIARRALVHGHCHQKAHAVVDPIREALSLVPNLAVEMIESSCCGMAGAFGYQAESQEVSRAMAELSLAPTVRAAPEDSLIVADGTSCRAQIADFGGREALHVARILEMSLDAEAAV